MIRYCEVAVNFPKFESLLSYKTDKEFEIGQIVEVPLGNRKAKGVVLAYQSVEDLDPSFSKDKIKEILGPIEGAYPIDEKERELYSWMSKYYHYSMGKLIFDCLPKVLKRPRKKEFKTGAGEKLPHELNPK